MRRPVAVAGILLLALALCVDASAAGDALPDQQEPGLRRLLLHDCGACHGMRLEGGLGPALTTGVLAGRTPEQLFEVISNGRSGTAMPPWSPVLSDREIAWLVQELLRGATLTH